MIAMTQNNNKEINDKNVKTSEKNIMTKNKEN